MFNVILAIILRIFSNPIANTYEKKVSTNGSSLCTSLYSYLIMSLCCIPFAFKYNWTSLSPEFWKYALLAGALCAGGRACMVKALQLGELSVLGPVNSYKAVVGIIIGIFLLGEIPDIYGLFGVTLIIFGSWFVFDTQKEGFSIKLFKRKDIMLRFIALFLTGIEAVILKKIIILSSVTISYIMWAWTGAFFTFLFVLVGKREFAPIKKGQLHQYLIICLSLAIMQLSTNFVFQHIKVGYALSLFQLSTIINLIFGIKIFKEKDFKKKIIGSAIMMIGSIVVILS